MNRKPNYAFRVDMPDGTSIHRLSTVQLMFVAVTRVKRRWQVVSWCQSKRAASARCTESRRILYDSIRHTGLKEHDVEARLLPCVAVDLPEVTLVNVWWRGARLRTMYTPEWGEVRPTHVVVGQVEGRWVPELWAGSRLEAEQALDAARLKYGVVEIVDVPAGAR